MATTTAPLNFYLPGGEGTDDLYVGFSKNKELKFDVKEIEIHDTRGQEDQFSLDKNGFSFHKAPTSFTAFDDDAAIRSTYFHEVEEYVCKLYV